MTILMLQQVLVLLALQAAPIPDVNLTVSFREKVEGEAQRRPIYVLEVLCSKGECSYTYVSLNDCGATRSGSRGFYPKVQKASTADGDVKAVNEGSVLTLEQTGTDSLGDWINTFRIGYEPTTTGSPATRVVSFSGTFVKTSEIIKRPTRIEYIPLQGPFQEVNLECGLLAPGVDPK